MREQIELTMGPGGIRSGGETPFGEDEQVEIRQNLPARLKGRCRRDSRLERWNIC